MTDVNHRCAVLGRPIAHSLSPVLHNAAYRVLGLDRWEYGKCEVGQEGLDGFLKHLDPTWAGLSLTMPLKTTIQPYGTASNDWARRLGVANTAVFDWSRASRLDSWPYGKPDIKLYNTDVIGIVLAFAHALGRSQASFDAAGGGQALVIGNGNTAGSAVAACKMTPRIDRIVVAARHPGANPSLQRVAHTCMGTGSLREIGLDDARALRDELSRSSIVISTIPAHAADGVAELLASGVGRRPGLRGALLDVVYDPRPTELMRAWDGCGGRILGGEEMLLYQALVQVLLMTSVWTSDRLSDGAGLSSVMGDSDIVRLEHAMRTALEEAMR